MQIEVLPDVGDVAKRAAVVVAAEARAAVAARGRFVFAVSGGRTPWIMLRALADEEIPWGSVHIVQVDERVAPAGHADRNLTHLLDSLLAHVPLRPEQVHAMPVESADLDAACRAYSETLAGIAGTPPLIDLVHLGLGSDGHTASLIPGDPVLQEVTADVATTGLYQGRRRMSLTYPILNRAPKILWLVTGSDKSRALKLLSRSDPSIPAGRVDLNGSLILADRAASAELDPEFEQSPTRIHDQ